MSIYSKLNTPNEFYIYAYLRDDGTPYYIGKGQGKRARISHAIKGKGAHTPKDESKIVICESNLIETGAFALERRAKTSLIIKEWWAQRKASELVRPVAK